MLPRVTSGHSICAGERVVHACGRHRGGGWWCRCYLYIYIYFRASGSVRLASSLSPSSSRLCLPSMLFCPLWFPHPPSDTKDIGGDNWKEAGVGEFARTFGGNWGGNWGEVGWKLKGKWEGIGEKVRRNLRGSIGGN